MPIAGGLRDELKPGMVLVGRYRGVDYRAEVIEGEDGKVHYRLDDGREFRSPSAAASAVMNGTAANGWRWWSLQGDPPQTDATASPVKTRKPRKSKATPEAVETTESEVTTEAAPVE